MAKPRKQCRKCPWKKSTNPHEIPNGYSVEAHRALECTIANDGGLGALGGTLHVMACHESRPGKEFACAGWVEHQLGPGNNIALRLRVMRGEIEIPVTEGEQHESFEDTLPPAPARMKRLSLGG